MTRPVLKFLSLTFAATWTCWAAAFAISRDSAPATPALAAVARVVFLLGVFAPGLVALALTEQDEGRATTRTLFGRVFQWRVAPGWYVFAIGYMPAIKLSVALAHRAATGAWPRFTEEPWYLLAAAITVSMWVQAGEEIGWRGYVLPRLTDRVGLAPASVILGIVWAIWHVPLFLVPDGNTSGQSFPLYLLQVTALSVAMAWLYWRTEASLLLVMLLHATVNNTPHLVPSAVLRTATPFALSAPLAEWLMTAFLWMTAAYLLVRMARIATIPGGTSRAMFAAGFTTS